MSWAITTAAAVVTRHPHLQHLAVGVLGHTRLSLAILHARGMRTRREFADALGVTEKTCWAWEAGRTRPTRVRDVNALHHAGIPTSSACRVAGGGVVIAWCTGDESRVRPLAATAPLGRVRRRA